MRWARETAGQSREAAAKRAGVAPERVAAWEDGTAKPTVAKLRSLADLYGRPLAAFYLPAAPDEPTITDLKDFRRRGGSGAPVPDGSPPLRLAVRRAYEQRETALELLGDLGEDPTSVPRRQDADAQWIRSWLEVQEDEQLTWVDAYEALRSWTAAAERKGLLVIQFQGVEPDECSGFAIPDRPLPVVALNASEAPTGRSFTLLHEVVHVLEGEQQGVLCSIRHRAERRANELAAEVLMPAELTRMLYRSSDARPEDRLIEVARRLRVSPEAMSYRLRELGLASVRPPARSVRQSSKVPFPHWRKQVRNLGRAYVRLALEAHAHGSLTTAELLGICNIKTRDLPKVRQVVS
jgi:Zn-dependent peptidase ImmA (M78 family)/DNA-binding XRE family transcriptional regulator